MVSFMSPAAVPTWKGHPLLTEQEARWVLQPVWIPRRGKNLLSLLGIELKFLGYSDYSLVIIMTTQSWLHKTTKLKLTFNIHKKFFFERKYERISILLIWIRGFHLSFHYRTQNC